MMPTYFMEKIEINTSPENLDVNFINNFISNSYWAKGRTVDEMKICINNSLNFGVYLNHQQIGYARVVTDYFQFAYIMDLFIDDAHRGNGYSKILMKYILEFESVKKIKVWRLSTTNAQWLYEKFGFTKLAAPEKIMEKIK